MPRNGNGVYTLPGGINPVVTQTLITSNWANTTMSDLAGAITESLSRDGQTIPTANLPMNNYRHFACGDPQSLNDYATLGYVQYGSHIRLALTGGDFNDLTAVLVGGSITPAIGQMVQLVPEGMNTGPVTISINGGPVYPVLNGAGAPLSAGRLVQGYPDLMVWTGTFWQIAASDITATGYVQEAPVNGLPYARKDAAWIQTVEVAANGSVTIAAVGQPLVVRGSGAGLPTVGGTPGIKISSSDPAAPALAGITFFGADDGAAERHGASIVMTKTAPWVNNSGSYPASLGFWTRGVAAGSEVEAMRINPDGSTLVNGFTQFMSGFYSALPVQVNAKIQFADYLESVTGSAIIGTAVAGIIALRPNGIANPAGQASLDAGGGFQADYLVSQNHLSFNASLNFATAGAGTMIWRPNGLGSNVGEMRLEASGLFTASNYGEAAPTNNDANLAPSAYHGITADPSLNTPNGSYNDLLGFGSSGNGYQTQLARPWFGADLYVRVKNTPTWGAWRKVLDTGNVGVIPTTIRATGKADPAAGAGVEVNWGGASGTIVAFDRTGGTYMPLVVAASNIDIRSGGTVRIALNPTGLAFFGGAPVAKPTVTGNKGGNAAMASLMAALAALGLVTDSTT